MNKKNSALSLDVWTTGESFNEKSYLKLFTRFLRYGLLAWGGPIGQLALIEREMVYQQKILSVGYFNRLISIYQAFPGPETHEICVHLGTQAKGPLGGLLAGLGFMMPGFMLMLLCSWLYVLFGMTAFVTSILIAIKPAVIAWIVKGGIQLGRGILINKSLWFIALLAFFAEMLHLHFIIIFLASGILYTLFSHHISKPILKHGYTFIRANKEIIVTVIIGIAIACFSYFLFAIISRHFVKTVQPSLASILILGLKSGGLSFGSVYAILAIIKTDAINTHWLTHSQFIDGLAIAGSLPAPFVIVTTFVGYITHGLIGALVITFGTFLIPFIIPMYAYNFLNSIALNKKVRIFLDGITAGVAGLIAADVIDILRHIIINKLTIIIFIASVIFLYLYKSPYAILLLVAIATLVGALSFIV